MRSLDYLASRPEIDPTRLGCTGCSGGGTLTSYLMALDERIVAAAPSCYLTSLERLFATIGPQDAEQNITGQVAFGMEHADYCAAALPAPDADLRRHAGLLRHSRHVDHASAKPSGCTASWGTASGSICSSPTPATAFPSRSARRRSAGCAAGCLNNDDAPDGDRPLPRQGRRPAVHDQRPGAVAVPRAIGLRPERRSEPTSWRPPAPIAPAPPIWPPTCAGCWPCPK